MLDAQHLPAEGGALLLRHGHRPALPANGAGADLSLTNEGRERSRAMGALLRERLGNVYTSPVRRCWQTAHELCRGAGCRDRPTADRRLGDPGPFVIDAEAAWPCFRAHGAQGVARHQLRCTEALPGLRATQDGVTRLLRYILDAPMVLGRINVYITHDIVIAVLVAYLLGSSDVESLWPHFLEGVFLWTDTDHLHLRYRETVLTLPLRRTTVYRLT